MVVSTGPGTRVGDLPLEVEVEAAADMVLVITLLLLFTGKGKIAVRDRCTGLRAIRTRRAGRGVRIGGAWWGRVEGGFGGLGEVKREIREERRRQSVDKGDY